MPSARTVTGVEDRCPRTCAAACRLTGVQGQHPQLLGVEPAGPRPLRRSACRRRSLTSGIPENASTERMVGGRQHRDGLPRRRRGPVRGPGTDAPGRPSSGRPGGARTEAQTRASYAEENNGGRSPGRTAYARAQHRVAVDHPVVTGRVLVEGEDARGLRRGRFGVGVAGHLEPDHVGRRLGDRDAGVRGVPVQDQERQPARRSPPHPSPALGSRSRNGSTDQGRTGPAQASRLSGMRSPWRCGSGRGVSSCPRR